ncbi:MAG: response regulator [Deltaproteobacteria bacterium]|nr:response regulator [Deltaproteobacteria bacterium]MBW1923126.1 response regulator [Deltaproteobacteria bacterium]MBW1949150.1 response regulator [Deltaproteobacteria bacterium]MBW2007533.1 response regulator [Deltaproteobacteria bacterium]MBW2101535.1 response regulator [Deltaproteobacteria bacterium]
MKKDDTPQERSQEALQETNSEGIRLLLVDDEAGFVEVLSKRMAKRGIRVTKAHSGTEAIQTLRKNDFDVTVLDLKMEDMEGIEVLKIFKKMAPEMPVIMLTGHGSNQAAREGMQWGAHDYLTKPCELEELVEKIFEAVRERKER